MATQPADTPDPAVFTLHRYFIWANRMRDHLADILEKQGPVPTTHAAMSAAEREQTEADARQWFLSVFLYASYWLGTLYVIVEGWRRLKLADPGVDAVLADRAFVERLRQYRNGVFHFQPTYLDDRFMNFVKKQSASETPQAARLHDALSDFFLSWIARSHDAPPPSVPP